MDLNEAGQRIFRRHWGLILLLAILGALVPIAIAKVHNPGYVGTSRIELGSDAQGSQQANALADTALAIATSPDVLKQAIALGKVPRDPATLLTEVTVTPVGTSGVLELSVTDPDARIAARAANALGDRVVQVRSEDLLGNTQQLLDQVKQQYTSVNQQIAAIEQSIQDQARIVPATFAQLQARDSLVTTLSLQHSAALSQAAALDRERQQLSAQLASTSRPQVIDASQSSGIPADVSLPARMAIGALLGLLLGIALAAARETVHPSLYLAVLARHLDAPLLGRLPRAPHADSAVEDPWLAAYVAAAAESAGVRSVQLVSVGKSPADVTGLARSLDGRAGLRVTALELPGPGNDAVPPAVGADTGIVVIAPKVVKGRHLSGLERHLRVTRQPVLGVVTYVGRPSAPAPQPETGSPAAGERQGTPARETAASAASA